MLKKIFSTKFLVLGFFLVSLSIVFSLYMVVSSGVSAQYDRLYPSGHTLSTRVINTDYLGVDINSQKVVINTGNKDLFIPLKTPNEWSLFQAAAENWDDVVIGGFCGDSKCELNYIATTNWIENSCNCPQDCPGSCCGNGICESGETYYNCSSDCSAPPPPPPSTDCTYNSDCPAGQDCFDVLFVCEGGWHCRDFVLDAQECVDNGCWVNLHAQGYCEER